MTPNQAAALQHVAAAILEAVDAARKLGAPSGVVYAALMGQGCTLEQYQKIISGLARAGMLDTAGDLLHCTEKGRAFYARIFSKAAA